VSRGAVAAAVVLVLAGLCAAPLPVGGEAPTTGKAARTDPLPPEVVRGHCSVCHSYDLVAQQRLDRANWDWVMEDMIDKYGALWIDPALRERIVDYLVEHHGPAR
jgi:hypothetical protein